MHVLIGFVRIIGHSDHMANGRSRPLMDCPPWLEVLHFPRHGKFLVENFIFAYHPCIWCPIVKLGLILFD